MWANNKNDAGFSPVEVVMVVIIIALIGTVGWLVYKNHNKTNTNNSNAVSAGSSSKSVQPKASQVVDPYASWKTGTLQYEKITYRYPSDWTVKDQSEALPKSQDRCTYPGHDLVTLSSPSGAQVNLNAGQDCFGDDGVKAFGSVHINSLGQNLYLVFEAFDGVETPTAADSACLAPSTDPGGQFALKSKNIFYNGDDTGGSAPLNSFCYIPYNPSKYPGAAPTFTVDQIKNSADYPQAKLILESLRY